MAIKLPCGEIHVILDSLVDSMLAIIQPNNKQEKKLMIINNNKE